MPINLNVATRSAIDKNNFGSAFMNRRYISIAVAVLLLSIISGSTKFSNPLLHLEYAHAFSVLEKPVSVPDNPFKDGIALLEQKNYQSAISAFDLAIANEPLIAHYIERYKAEALLEKGATDAGLKLLQKISARRDRSVSKKALLRILDIASLEKRFDMAIEACNSIENISEESERIQMRIKKAELIAMQGDTSSALNILYPIAAIDHKPVIAAQAIRVIINLTNSENNLKNYADILFDAGDFFTAAVLYEKILSEQNNPDAKLIFKLARSYERADDFRTAVGNFKRLLDMNTSISRDIINYRIALCHQRLGEDKEAEKWYQNIIQEYPHSSFTDDVLFRIASLRDKRDDREEAHRLYSRIIEKFPRSSWADDAAWKIGFGFLEDGKSSEARKIFSWARRRFPKSDYNSAFAYWDARLLEIEGKKDLALESYLEILKKGIQPYYRYRAIAGFKRLDGVFSEKDIQSALNKATDGDVLPALAELRAIRDGSSGELKESAGEHARQLLRRVGYWQNVNDFSVALFDTSAILKDIELNQDNSQLISEITRLIELGIWNDASEEILALPIDEGPRPEKRLAVARILAAAGRYRDAMKLSESLLSSLGYSNDIQSLPPLFGRLLFPRYFSQYIEEASSKYKLDPNFVLAVIREESRFNSDAVSPVGARGLMQIMPATGNHISNSLGRDNFTPDDLRSPSTNVLFGAYYLNSLLTTYDGKKYLALAGYNAGPGNANRWLRQYPDTEEDIFIERISFRETRNYVKRVLGTYWIYSSLNDIQ